MAMWSKRGVTKFRTKNVFHGRIFRISIARKLRFFHAKIEPEPLVNDHERVYAPDTRVLVPV